MISVFLFLFRQNKNALNKVSVYRLFKDFNKVLAQKTIVEYMFKTKFNIKINGRLHVKIKILCICLIF